MSHYGTPTDFFDRLNTEKPHIDLVTRNSRAMHELEQDIKMSKGDPVAFLCSNIAQEIVNWRIFFNSHSQLELWRHTFSDHQPQGSDIVFISEPPPPIDLDQLREEMAQMRADLAECKRIQSRIDAMLQARENGGNHLP